jgi:hypothetical protein
VAAHQLWWLSLASGTWRRMRRGQTGPAGAAAHPSPPLLACLRRGGLTCLDRDYGIFNKIQHDIGTHVVHHLFPQIPHYHLQDATEAAKKVGAALPAWPGQVHVQVPRQVPRLVSWVACCAASPVAAATPPLLKPAHLNTPPPASPPTPPLQVMGPYYREPTKSAGWFPTHLYTALVHSFKHDHYVADEGDIVYYQQDAKLAAGGKA